MKFGVKEVVQNSTRYQEVSQKSTLSLLIYSIENDNFAANDRLLSSPTFSKRLQYEKNKALNERMTTTLNSLNIGIPEGRVFY